MSVSIADFSEEKGVVFYNINVNLPLRSILVQRRFSEFISLFNDLCSDVGISAADFPYSLPGKGGVFTGKSRLAASRIKPLEEFLNGVVADRDLQNRAAVHKFLELPRNFKFSSSNDQEKKVLNSDDITASNWLSHLRLLRGAMSQLGKTTDMKSKTAERTQINSQIIPQADHLGRALEALMKSKEISSSEYKLRLNNINSLKSEAQDLLAAKAAPPSSWSANPGSGRDLGGARKIQETNDTIALSNKELLQKQQQVHREQDQELEELRRAIANQRRIGEAINKEVSEQNEILDELNSEVEASRGKLENARSRTRKIG
ncbi:hypothetical protein PUMCH_003944 [Australozyma saopauloensis]|uniref:Uncharacterized protein n=1 Tax=Australozyma saopauloensis TaxID=291208 RepID=A0AAX4HDU8_9ASCO|nr:hypothetical protein PUMCH_003944 [[Candida] saopauloensis]